MKTKYEKIKVYKSKGFVKVSQAALTGHPKAKIFESAFQKHLAVKAWHNAADQFFEEAGNKTRAIDFKEGVLFVACLSKELAYKIKMFAQRIIYLLNQLIGKELVFALKIEL